MDILEIILCVLLAMNLFLTAIDIFFRARLDLQHFPVEESREVEQLKKLGNGQS